MRDAKTSRLLAGGGDANLFVDVSAINEHLDDPRATHALFIELERLRPSVAQAVADGVLKEMVDAADFSRAAKYMPSPEPEVEQMRTQLVNDVLRAKSRPPRMQVALRRAHCRNYAERVLLLASILHGNDRIEEAMRLRLLALDLSGTQLRTAVAKAFRECEAAMPGCGA